MLNNNKLKIIVVSNTPSNTALKNFQKKLYEIQQNVELNKTTCPIHNKEVVKSQ